MLRDRFVDSFRNADGSRHSVRQAGNFLKKQGKCRRAIHFYTLTAVGICSEIWGVEMCNCICIRTIFESCQVKQIFARSLKSSVNLPVTVHNSDHALIEQRLSGAGGGNVKEVMRAVIDGEVSFHRIDQSLLIHQFSIHDQFPLQILPDALFRAFLIRRGLHQNIVISQYFFQCEYCPVSRGGRDTGEYFLHSSERYSRKCRDVLVCETEGLLAGLHFFYGHRFLPPRTPIDFALFAYFNYYVFRYTSYLLINVSRAIHTCQLKNTCRKCFLSLSYCSGQRLSSYKRITNTPLHRIVFLSVF